MVDINDIVGKSFGSLKILSYSHYKLECGKYTENAKKVFYYNCLCDCGKKLLLDRESIVLGKIKNCKNIKRHPKHGLRKTKLYDVFHGMKQRCYSKKSKSYKNYGGRGICVCDEWNNNTNGLVNFYNWAVNNGYKEGLTIDRINVNGDYEPSNCRWVSMKKQQQNKRTNKIIEINGVKKCVSEWLREYKITNQTFYKRIKNGYTYIDALTKNVQQKNFRKFLMNDGSIKTIPEIAKSKKMTRAAVYEYIRRGGLSRFGIVKSL